MEKICTINKGDDHVIYKSKKGVKNSEEKPLDNN